MPSILSAISNYVMRGESDNYTGHAHVRTPNLAVAEEGKFTRVLRYKDYANMKEKQLNSHRLMQKRMPALHTYTMQEKARIRNITSK